MSQVELPIKLEQIKSEPGDYLQIDAEEQDMYYAGIIGAKLGAEKVSSTKRGKGTCEKAWISYMKSAEAKCVTKRLAWRQ